jgi:hypothetical protein
MAKRKLWFECMNRGVLVAIIGGMNYGDTQQFINYSSNPVGNVSGTVDAQAYLNWLKAAGYDINMTVQ